MKRVRFFLALLLFFSQVVSAEMQAYPAPEWQLKTLDGQTVSWQQFRGQPVILMFWATWCPYCKKLMPGLQRLQHKYRDRGLQVILIDYNEDEDADIAGALHARGIALLNVVNGDAVAARYNVAATPTTFYIDRDGKIVGKSNNSNPDAVELERYAQWITK